MAQFIELRHWLGALAEKNGAGGSCTTEWPASRIESPRGQACYEHRAGMVEEERDHDNNGYAKQRNSENLAASREVRLLMPAKGPTL